MTWLMGVLHVPRIHRRKPIVLVLLTTAVCAAVLLHGRGPGPSIACKPATAVLLPNTAPAAMISSDIGQGPYRFPKYIHQTVKDKSKLSCQARKAIDSWKALNPGYTYKLWDDDDIKDFMVKFYPGLVPVPFDEFLTGTERSDLWRILVLHQFGGVYADIDVQCVKPIDHWNSDHSYDAEVLLGVENYQENRTHPLHVVNWVLAAMPGHSLLGSMPSIVSKVIQEQYFQAANSEYAVLNRKNYEEGIIDRTGPAALTRAMYEYLLLYDKGIMSVSYENVTSPNGVLVGGVRVLPIDCMATGWELADARGKGIALSCEDVVKKVPDALVCHMFWGSWRSNWQFRQEFTYGKEC
eukprot:GHRR01002619.1.p1 GENE.GHRR01002619.1~~GHRR01002619.1.p1  ORF type:complete len:352 (+),score=66.11 GHRR01002619.1:92-1147(+)